MKTKYTLLLLSALLLAFMSSCSDVKTGNNMKEDVALETLKTRRAIRAYQDKMPAKELIQKVMEAGTYAPTGMGKQSPVIVAITNKEVRDRLSQLNAKVMGRNADPFYGDPGGAGRVSGQATSHLFI